MAPALTSNAYGETGSGKRLPEPPPRADRKAGGDHEQRRADASDEAKWTTHGAVTDAAAGRPQRAAARKAAGL